MKTDQIHDMAVEYVGANCSYIGNGMYFISYNGEGKSSNCTNEIRKWVEEKMNARKDVEMTRTVAVTVRGEDYSICHDDSRDRLQPKWYVQRHSDWKVSTRYYSWPPGAFNALWWASVKWETD